MAEQTQPTDFELKAKNYLNARQSYEQLKEDITNPQARTAAKFITGEEAFLDRDASLEDIGLATKYFEDVTLDIYQKGFHKSAEENLEMMVDAFAAKDESLVNYILEFNPTNITESDEYQEIKEYHEKIHNARKQMASVKEGKLDQEAINQILQSISEEHADLETTRYSEQGYEVDEEIFNKIKASKMASLQRRVNRGQMEPLLGHYQQLMQNYVPNLTKTLLGSEGKNKENAKKYLLHTLENAKDKDETYIKLAGLYSQLTQKSKE